MSKVAGDIADPLHVYDDKTRKMASDPLGVYEVFDKPKTPEAEAAEAAGANPEVAERSKDFALRGASVGARATAAGAQRSENDADLLGYSGTRRASAASRKLLG